MASLFSFIVAMCLCGIVSGRTYHIHYHHINCDDINNEVTGVIKRYEFIGNLFIGENFKRHFTSLKKFNNEITKDAMKERVLNLGCEYVAKKHFYQLDEAHANMCEKYEQTLNGVVNRLNNGFNEARDISFYSIFGVSKNALMSCHCSSVKVPLSEEGRVNFEKGKTTAKFWLIFWFLTVTGLFVKYVIY